MFLRGRVDDPCTGRHPTPGQHHPWIADNQQKGISPNEKLITLQADPDYSRRYRTRPRSRS
ncbi:MAG: hypothetical protein R2856_30640 [Caldilineaceae bacterium]